MAVQKQESLRINDENIILREENEFLKRELASTREQLVISQSKFPIVTE